LKNSITLGLSNCSVAFTALLVFCLVVAPAGGTAAAEILLGDIVGGGDGTGGVPAEFMGVNPQTGQFSADAAERDYGPGDPNPAPGASAFIDSVFVLGPNPDGLVTVTQDITQSGVTFDFDGNDCLGRGYNLILKDQNGGVVGPIVIGGLPFTRAVGIHAAMGITFSLDVMRDVYGPEAVGCFTTFWGLDAGGGSVTLYAILSSEQGTLNVQTFRAGGNSGQLLQLEIPLEARYLTLASGSNGLNAWDLSSDHGTFGLATIGPAPCAPPALVSMQAVPPSVTVNPNVQFPLQVTGVDILGRTVDAAPAAAGTVYASDRPDVVDVDGEGVLRTKAEGSATVTVTNGGVSIEVPVFVRAFIDLGIAAAGGDGKSQPPDGNIGIETGTGAFVQFRRPDTYPDSDGINPQPIDAALIDCVFVIGQAEQVIATDLTTFSFDAADVSNGWEAILNHREPDGPDYLKFGDKGPFYSGLGIHAAQGITYDLGAMRDAHGAAAVRYVSAVLGSTAGLVNCYVILSSSDGPIVTESALGLSGGGNKTVELAIPPEASFLTLAVGASDGSISGDHGGFGIARITPRSLSEDLSAIASPVASIVLQPGDTAAISLTGIVAWPELAGLEVPVDPSLASYLSADSAVAGVDALGIVTGKSRGQTTITATVGSASTSIAVTVAAASVTFKRGDTNASGTLNIADAVCLLGFLFGPGTDPCKLGVPRCADAADANNDGKIDVADAVKILGHLFAQAGPLPEPFAACGDDAGDPPDSLDCTTFTPCGK
jgi:hypothetical protein